jgi:hypothetical protein
LTSFGYACPRKHLEAVFFCLLRGLKLEWCAVLRYYAAIRLSGELVLVIELLCQKPLTPPLKPLHVSVALFSKELPDLCKIPFGDLRDDGRIASNLCCYA